MAAKAEMVKAICHELELNRSWLPDINLKSIYFGGGTPSLLSIEELGEIFNTISRHFKIAESAEITFEVNPDDVNIKQLKDWLSLGINRLSIGLQSFNDEELRWMNRAHTSAQSESSVKLAQDSGFSNITIDLIYGSKFQTLHNWERTLERACNLNTTHISAYNLTIENKTVLGVRNKRGQEPAVDEDLSSAEFLMMISHLKKEGFIQYEVSNFGKPGFFALHNSNYWLGKPYLGLGPSAHSFNGRIRKWNISNNARYLREIKGSGQYFESEHLTTENRYNEYILTRLRTIWGCDIIEMEQLFGTAFKNRFLKEIEQFSSFIVKKENIFCLNDEGKLKADGIAAALFL